MSGTERLIRFAAATLPPPVRARYREEWLADAAGADEVGVSRIGVVVGALLFSATLDRTAPQLTGIPIAATVRRRAQWSIALLASAGVFTVGSWMFGGYRSPGRVARSRSSRWCSRCCRSPYPWWPSSPRWAG